MPSIIIQNAVKLNHPNGDIEYIKSTHVHDFKSFCVGEYEGFIDGGNDYLRRSIFPNNNLIEDYCLSNSSSLEEIKNKLLWGCFEESNNTKYIFLPIKELTSEQLKIILKNQNITQLPLYKFIMEFWEKEKSTQK